MRAPLPGRLLASLSWRVAAASASLPACSEHDFASDGTDAVAVVTGDFDDVSEPLLRLDIRHDIYDGVVGRAAWDPEYDPESHDLTVEGLFADFGVLRTYSGLVVASGARGFGDVVYNGVDPDDAFAGDPLVVEALSHYAGDSRFLLATDWTYDLVERAWPGKIDFVGDDGTLDGAQTGIVEQIEARIVEPALSRALGTDTVTLTYNFSNWAPMVDVAGDVVVWLRGDVHYRLPGEEVEREIADAPLLVSFYPPEGDGTVVYASFHVDVQHDQFADELYRTVLGIGRGDG